MINILRILLLLGGLFITQLSVAQTPESFFLFSKTWNYLKYYHPDLASGKIQADSLFLDKVDQIKGGMSQDQIASMLIEALDNIKSSDQHLIPDSTEIILSDKRNFEWYQSNTELNNRTKKELSSIYVNRYVGASHYYLPELGWQGDLPHETSYEFEKEENLPLSYRLLAFAKIQGAVDYLYPYKYLMSSDFDSLSKRKLEELIDSDSRIGFERILAELVASLEDTHASNFYQELTHRKEILNSNFFPPFMYQLRDGYILITAIILPELAEQAGIKAGDKILEVNGVSIPALIREKAHILSVSNQEVLKARLSNYLSNILWNNSNASNTLKIASEGQEKLVQLNFISSSDKEEIQLINSYLQSNYRNPIPDLPQDVAYFKIDETYHFVEQLVEDEASDAVLNARMDSIFQQATTKEAIIFDMRGYPDWGGFVHTFVYRYFGKAENYYHRIYFPNKQDIGTWVYQSGSEHYFPQIPDKPMNNYQGKVFILVNPETLSQSELSTMNLQHIFPMAITIGQQTAGADGNIKTMPLPGGYLFSFTGLVVEYPDKSLTQKVGIHIDEKVQYSDKDWIYRVDRTLERVLELLED